MLRRTLASKTAAFHGTVNSGEQSLATGEIVGDSCAKESSNPTKVDSLHESCPTYKVASVRRPFMPR